MADDDPADVGEGGPAFAQATSADRVVRFGCGAALASLIVTALVMFGLPVPFGMAGVATLWIALVGVVGLLSLTYGERFVRGLLKLISWLA